MNESPLVVVGGLTVRRLQAIMDEITAAGDALIREVPVETVATTGSAAAVLVEEAADADLLVVGHRGRGRSAVRCSARSGSGACCTPHAR